MNKVLRAFALFAAFFPLGSFASEVTCSFAENCGPFYGPAVQGSLTFDPARRTDIYGDGVTQSVQHLTVDVSKAPPILVGSFVISGGPSYTFSDGYPYNWAQR